MLAVTTFVKAVGLMDVWAMTWDGFAPAAINAAAMIDRQRFLPPKSRDDKTERMTLNLCDIRVENFGDWRALHCWPSSLNLSPFFCRRKSPKPITSTALLFAIPLVVTNLGFGHVGVVKDLVIPKTADKTRTWARAVRFMVIRLTRLYYKEQLKWSFFCCWDRGILREKYRCRFVIVDDVFFWHEIWNWNKKEFGRKRYFEGRASKRPGYKMESMGIRNPLFITLCQNNILARMNLKLDNFSIFEIRKKNQNPIWR